MVRSDHMVVVFALYERKNGKRGNCKYRSSLAGVPAGPGAAEGPDRQLRTSSYVRRTRRVNHTFSTRLRARLHTLYTRGPGSMALPDTKRANAIGTRCVMPNQTKLPLYRSQILRMWTDAPAHRLPTWRFSL